VYNGKKKKTANSQIVFTKKVKGKEITLQSPNIKTEKQHQKNINTATVVEKNKQHVFAENTLQGTSTQPIARLLKLTSFPPLNCNDVPH